MSEQIDINVQNEWLHFLLQKTPDTSQLFESVFKSAIAISGLPFACVTKLRHGTHLRVEAVADPIGLGMKAGEEYPITELISGEVIQKKDGIVIPNISKTPLARHPGVQRMGIRSFLGIPLYIDDKHIYGTLSLLAQKPQEIGEAELLKVSLLGQWLAKEIKIRKLTRENDSKTQRLSVLSQETEKLRSQLESSSYRDPVTDLFNSRYFNKLVQVETARARRHKYPISLLLVHLDGFSGVSRQQPVQTSHAVLSSMAALLRRHLRTIDHASRYGEEVFAILLPQTDLSGASVVAERIRGTVSKHRFSLSNEDSVVLTTSIGVSGMVAQEEDPVRGMLLRARRALEQSRNTGGNCIHFIK